MRSGIEVYGRRRGATARPDEAVHPDPTSAFGRTLALVEEVAEGAGRAADVPVTLLRLAPVLGPHVPSPLGRYLRLPVVPVELLADPRPDAAPRRRRRGGHRGCGPSRGGWAGQRGGRGRRHAAARPCGWATGCRSWSLGPPWWLARAVGRAAGAPVPEHLIELLSRGRVADGGRAAALLGTGPALVVAGRGQGALPLGQRHPPAPTRRGGGLMSAVLPFERDEPDLDAGGGWARSGGASPGPTRSTRGASTEMSASVAARLARLRWSASVEGVPPARRLARRCSWPTTVSRRWPRSPRCWRSVTERGRPCASPASLDVEPVGHRRRDASGA